MANLGNWGEDAREIGLMRHERQYKSLKVGGN